MANHAGSLSSVATMAGTGTPVGASASMMRAWRSMSCLPIGCWPGGTDFTTSAPSPVSTR